MLQWYIVTVTLKEEVGSMVDPDMRFMVQAHDVSEALRVMTFAWKGSEVEGVSIYACVSFLDKDKPYFSI